MAVARGRLRAAVTLGVVSVAAALLAACGSTQLALDRPTSGLLPTKVDGYSVSATSESQDLANQLKSLAPGITETSGAELQKDGQPSGLEVYALKGPRNSLNEVTLTLIRNEGSGRSGDAWGAAEQGQKYQHSSTEINGVSVDEVSAVVGNGQLSESWLVARPSDGVLLLAHNQSGNVDSGEAAMKGLIAGASQ